MKDYQQRLIDEKAEIDVRTEKLREFMEGDIFDSIDYSQQDLYRVQLCAMETYRLCLGLRIANFQRIST